MSQMICLEKAAAEWLISSELMERASKWWQSLRPWPGDSGGWRFPAESTWPWDKSVWLVVARHWECCRDDARGCCQPRGCHCRPRSCTQRDAEPVSPLTPAPCPRLPAPPHHIQAPRGAGTPTTLPKQLLRTSWFDSSPGISKPLGAHLPGPAPGCRNPAVSQASHRTPCSPRSLETSRVSSCNLAPGRDRERPLSCGITSLAGGSRVTQTGSEKSTSPFLTPP